MYLSDRKSVAESYASERAPTPNARRVYAVDIETGNLRVLDLTKDPRWQKAMQPLAPGLPSNETLIKQANENYSSRAELSETVTALERIRLDLLRLHGGLADLQPITTTLDAARLIEVDIDRLRAAQREVSSIAHLPIDVRTPTPA